MNNNEQETKDLAQSVMKEITEKKVTMKPKIYFVLATLFLIVGFAGLVLLAVFLANIVFFRLRVQGPFGFLLFGQSGLRVFVSLFPWKILLLSTVSLLGGVLILKKTDYSYKFNFVVLVLGLVVLVVLSGVFFDRMGVNERLSPYPRVKGLYRHQFVSDNWLMGEVINLEGSLFTLKSPDGRQVKVLRDNQTLLPLGAVFKEGERVRVIGEWQEGVFQARGIIMGGLNWRPTVAPLQGFPRKHFLPW